MKMAKQLTGEVMRITRPVMKERARAITAADRKFSPYDTIRMARATARFAGIRAKRAKEAAEDPEAAKEAKAKAAKAKAAKAAKGGKKK